jgi:hypothetical protein
MVCHDSVGALKDNPASVLKSMAKTGGDQGLLNRFFPNWHRLPFVYNCNTGAFIHRMKSGETDYKKYGISAVVNLTRCTVQIRNLMIRRELIKNNIVFPYVTKFCLRRAKVLHFLGQNKPWHWPCERYQKETANPDADVCSLLSLWWDFYDRAIA